MMSNTQSASGEVKLSRFQQLAKGFRRGFSQWLQLDYYCNEGCRFMLADKGIGWGVHPNSPDQYGEDYFSDRSAFIAKIETRELLRDTGRAEHIASQYAASKTL